MQEHQAILITKDRNIIMTRRCVLTLMAMVGKAEDEGMKDAEDDVEVEEVVDVATEGEAEERQCSSTHHNSNSWQALDRNTRIKLHQGGMDSLPL